MPVAMSLPGRTGSAFNPRGEWRIEGASSSGQICFVQHDLAIRETKLGNFSAR